ncbi:MAG: AraC family transcriptional regulator [Caldilineaceae bacterium]
MTTKQINRRKEWSQSWHNAQLDVRSLHAFYIYHAYARHTHDYYVLCVIEQGHQSFTHQGSQQRTPPGGLILINPDEVHTGEAVDGNGFQMRSLYPTAAHMSAAVRELTGREHPLPFFKQVRVDEAWASAALVAAHKALAQPESALEAESYFLWALVQLVEHYADQRVSEQRLGQEPVAIRRARHHIDECFDQGVTLTQLAEQVALSPYYLLRAFRAEIGMPPHAYLESVRVRHAQRLIESGIPLAQVAADVGFSSQSHFTNRFKQFIGVTPGQYAQGCC